MCTSDSACLLGGGLSGGSEAVDGCAGLQLRNVSLVGDDALGGEDRFGLWGLLVTLERRKKDVESADERDRAGHMKEEKEQAEPIESGLMRDGIADRRGECL